MTAPLIPLRANAELVAGAYLRAVMAAYATAVGAVLQGPDPATGVVTWGKTGFIQLTSISGTIDYNVPVRHTVVSLDVWATNRGESKRPPWNLAFSIAEAVVAATFDTQAHETHAVVTLPGDYPQARVLEFSALTEPSRRPSDPADFARVGFDVRFAWHGLGTTWTV